MEIVTVRSMLALLVLCGACSLMPAVQANNFRNCSDSSYSVRVDEVIILPQPVVIGENTTFAIAFTSEERRISNVTWRIEISGSSGIVALETYPLCEPTCEVGRPYWKTETIIFQGLQPGEYTVTMRIISEDGEELACVRSDIEIVEPAYFYIRKVSGI